MADALSFAATVYLIVAGLVAGLAVLSLPLLGLYWVATHASVFIP